MPMYSWVPHAFTGRFMNDIHWRQPLLGLVLAVILNCHALAVESQYEDSPVTMDIQVESLLDTYRVQALEKLPYFKEQFKNPAGRSFYVVTRIYEGKEYEQVFVGIEKIVDGVVFGKIKSQPVGRIDFEFDENIELADPAIVDWLIVNTDGTEEGNLLGKALDLLQVGYAAVLFQLTPENHRLKHCEVVSVRNAKTEQEVIKLMPDQVIQEMTAMMSEQRQDETFDTDTPVYTYILVSFPDWKIVSQ